MGFLFSLPLQISTEMGQVAGRALRTFLCFAAVNSSVFHTDLGLDPFCTAPSSCHTFLVPNITLPCPTPVLLWDVLLPLGLWILAALPCLFLYLLQIHESFLSWARGLLLSLPCLSLHLLQIPESSLSSQQCQPARAHCPRDLGS